MKNRKIKFRGLSETGWKFGYLFLTRFTNINQTGLIPVIQEINETEDGYNGYKVEKETLGQFTGLKDKNGKEIYEGDICLILYTDWSSNSSDMPLDEYLKSISHKGIIEYHDFSFYIMIKNIYDELSKNNLHYGKHGRIEVIGNIHENPEILNT